MARYRAEISSARSPDEAFDYLARFSSVVEWDPSVTSAEMVTREPVALGSEFRVVVHAMGRELPLVYRITTFARPRLVELVADNGRLKSNDTITVEPTGDGSRIVYDAQLTATGIAQLANPILALVLRRIGDNATAGLRDTIALPA
jgi:Polyketide cyclase / dehydrase and lipid transport